VNRRGCICRDLELLLKFLLLDWLLRAAWRYHAANLFRLETVAPTFDAYINAASSCRLCRGDCTEARESEGDNENFAHFKSPGSFLLLITWFKASIHQRFVRQ
jgi:hypothetical protein